MNGEDTVTLLTWINQYDPRVQVNAAARDIWRAALLFATLAEAKQAAEEHYRTNEAPSATPAAIRKRCMTIQATKEAKQRALTATPHQRITNPNSFRSRNPELWDQLAAQGAADRRAELESKGILK